MQRYFTVTGAYTEQGQQVGGVPDEATGTWGKFIANSPQGAGSKAYSSLIEYIEKFREQGWFTDIPKNTPIIVIIYEPANDKSFIYYASREVAPQAERQIISPDGRIRTYNWKNRLIPMKEGETVESALGRYQQRRTAAKQREHSF